jgi:S-DNA-T family DNA segregation ATPase FtsK/SpoIIIE
MSTPKFVRNGSGADSPILPPLEVGEAVSLLKPAPNPYPETGETASGQPETDPETAGGHPGLHLTEPIVPTWMRDPVSHARWVARRCYRLSLYHGLRFPSYAAKATGRTPVGMVRASQLAHRWATDAGSAPLLASAVQRQATAEWLHISKTRKETIGHRPIGAGLGALVFVALVAGGLLSGSLGLQALTVAGLVAVFGLGFGRPPGEPIIPSAVVSDPAAQKITHDQITRALIKAKLATDREPPDFFGKVHRDGKAWSVVVDLPAPYTALDAIKKRGAIASGLRKPSGRVFLRADSGEDAHDARLHIRIPDRDPMTGPPVPSPLVRLPRLDVWKDEIPFGLDDHGRLVELNPLWTHSLFAGMTDTGKSYSLRLQFLGLALDPTVRLAVFDSSAAPDWRDFELVAYRCGFGDDDETCRILRDTLREFVADVVTRNNAISRLPRTQAKEGKLTKELSRRFPPTWILLEECHDYFLHPTFGAEIRALVVKLVKIGRKAGYHVCLATQRPDADAVPTRIRAQFGFRFALRLDNNDANKMALGSGAADRGFDAVALSPSYKGVGIAYGPTVARRYEAGGTLVRCHYLDMDQAETVLKRCREQREGLGLLDGQAAGEEQTEWSLLDDLVAVFAIDGAAQLWSVELIERLRERYPDGRYHHWTLGTDEQAIAAAKNFAGAVAHLGLETVQIGRRIDGKTVNQRGLKRAAVLAAQDLIRQLSDITDDSDDDDTASDDGR